MCIRDSTYSLDTLPQEVASSGVGDFRDDSVRLTHPDGSCAADFRFESCEVVSGAYSIPGMPALYDTCLLYTSQKSKRSRR